MKIREILELTQSMNIAELAKEHLSIGEKKARTILKELGCTYQAGKAGWTYAGDQPEILEQSIYDFCTPMATKKRTDERKNEPTKERKYDTIKEDIKEPTKERKNNMRKRASFDIDTELLKELKIFAIKEEKNVYEIVEHAIREHLRGK